MKDLVKKVIRDDKAIRTMLEKGAQVIDVRTPAEFEAEHLPTAVNVPLEEIGDTIREIRRWNAPVVVVCRSGLRSQVATGILKSAGVEAIDGGVWKTLEGSLPTAA